jgi:hypothetical protein
LVTYFETAPEPGEDGAIDVRFGRQGHFRGKFVAKSTHREALLPGCSGEAPTVEVGSYVGSFVFDGARGFSRVDRPRVAGTITREPAETCRERTLPKSTGKSRSEGDAEAVRLIASDKSYDTVFSASREGEGS